MTDFDVHTDNKALLRAIEHLKIRFPVATLEKATGYTSGNISKYLSGKLPPSAKFLQKFQETFKVDLKDFSQDSGEIEMNENKVSPNLNQNRDDEYVDYVYENKDRLLKTNRKFQMLHHIIKLEVELEFMKQHPQK